MILSHKTDFALRTLMYLAGQDREEPGRKIPTREIAEAFQLSMNHLVKIIHELSQLGYISTTRGPGGGILLARNPEDIRIGEVIEAIEGPLNLHDCVHTEGLCVIESFCKLKGIFRQADQLQRDFLRQHTLADVLLPQRIGA
jgi:Rrf2 family nitric oxide-sensitive transcriptional repressor